MNTAIEWALILMEQIYIIHCCKSLHWKEAYRQQSERLPCMHGRTAKHEPRIMKGFRKLDWDIESTLGNCWRKIHNPPKLLFCSKINRAPSRSSESFCTVVSNFPVDYFFGWIFKTLNAIKTWKIYSRDQPGRCRTRTCYNSFVQFSRFCFLVSKRTIS